jgi:type VI secretion system secreted protein Hcp
MPIYMKYDGVTGEVTAAGHEQWVELGSLQWGVSRGINTPTGSGGDRNTTAPAISEVTVSKPFDGSSVGLFQELLTPGDSKKVLIDFVRTDKDKLSVFLSLELDQVMVSGYHVSSGGDGQPQETLNLNFTKIIVTETGTDQTGAAGQPNKAGYDLSTAKPL